MLAQRPTIDSVAEPVPALACKFDLDGYDSNLVTKKPEKGIGLYLDNFSATVLDSICEIFNLFLSEGARRFHLYI